MRRLLLSTFAVLLLAAGCTLVGGSEDGTGHAVTRATLAAKLAETQAAQDTALALWDRIIFGETVSCQVALPVPEAITKPVKNDTNGEAARAQLNLAIQSVAASASLWDSECADSRELVPLNVARSGRENALAASTPLEQVATLLAQ